MSGQIVWSEWFRPALEIRGRTNHSHAKVRPDTHPDHIFSDLLAKTNAGVITLSDDIDQTVVVADFDADVRVVKHELTNGGGQNNCGCVLHGSDAQAAGRFSTQFTHF